MASATTATLALPPLDTSAGDARLRCALWWDTEPQADVLVLEASEDGGATWRPVPFTTALPFTTTRHGDRAGGMPLRPVTGWSGRVWHRLTADLPAARQLALRWRYATDRLYVGRGVYVDGVRVETADGVLFDDARPADRVRIEANGWTPSAD
jgi:hypothetical protein